MATATSHLDGFDGFDHRPSIDAAVHRPLVVVDPPMEGRDVEAVQHATRERLRRRGLADDVAIATHGRFTTATALACIEAQYFLGLRSDTYLRRDARQRRVLTEGAQHLIRRPGLRDHAQVRRARDRRAELERSPRSYRDLARQLGLGGRGIGDALGFAAAHVGVTEQPPGSSAGPHINDWCRAAGYTHAVPWCGCFVNACVIAGGLPSGAGFIGFTPAILARARGRSGGWSFHMNGVPGDLALYDDQPGGEPVVHVEIVRMRLSETRYSTYGGDTGSGDGSPSDGGTVARHDDRSTRGGFRIIGFARPPWHTVL